MQGEQREKQTILVTGGAGFIGGNFVLATVGDFRVVNLDALTYAGNPDTLAPVSDNPDHVFVHGRIGDRELLDRLLAEFRPSAVINFAAETHVDRSIDGPKAFVQTNVVETHELLEAALSYWGVLEGEEHDAFRFLHVSTDEVYGPLLEGAATEDYPLRPTVPYAASKAASDLIALSYWQTYGAPVCVTRSSNNFGPCQHPEKIIPLFVTRLLCGEQVTLHDQGQHMRNWLHVEDNCAGIELVLRAGVPGQAYNIGGGTDLSSKELTGELLRICGADWDRVTYIPDRLSNDLRYAMNWGKLAALGYKPAHDFQAGLEETADWYRRNADRWAPLSRSSLPAMPSPRTVATSEKERQHA